MSDTTASSTDTKISVKDYAQAGLTLAYCGFAVAAGYRVGMMLADVLTGELERRAKKELAKKDAHNVTTLH